MGIIILYILLWIVIILFLYFLIKKTDPNIPDESNCNVRYKETDDLTNKLNENNLN